MANIEMQRGVIRRWKIDPERNKGFGVCFLDRCVTPLAGSFGSDIGVGDTIHALCELHTSDRYGDQYKIKQIVSHIPGTANMVTWLLLKLPNIGQQRARAIRETFGNELWRVLEHAHQELTAIDGITPARATEAHKVFMQEKDKVELASELQKLGVEEKTILQVFKKKIPASTIREFLKEDPYQLLRFHSVPFETADEIALRMDVQKDDARRVSGAMLACLREVRKKGSTAVRYNVLRQDARNMLGVPNSVIDARLRDSRNERFSPNFRFYEKNAQSAAAEDDDLVFATALRVNMSDTDFESGVALASARRTQEEDY